MSSVAKCHSDFQSLLADYEPGVLENDRGTIYGLWPDLTLAYLNPAWFRFAMENGGEPAISQHWRLGRNILEAVALPVRPFFEQNYRRCLREDRPWEHLYECSSDQHYRQFHMTAFPLGQSQALLVVNSLRIESDHQRHGNPPLGRLYMTEHSFVVQCCHCRRFRRVDVEGRWDWVPAWVKVMPPNTSHGICETCFGFYYSQQRFDDDPAQPFTSPSD